MRGGAKTAPMRQRCLPVLLAAAMGLGACTPAQPAVVTDVSAARGPADQVTVTRLEPPAGSGRGDRWEIAFTTTDAPRLVDAVRDVFVRLDYRIDDANDGLGFVADDTVEVREIYTTQPGARKILVTIGCCIEQYD